MPPASMGLSSGILRGDPLLLYPNKAVEVSEVRETTHISKSSDISEEVVQLIRNRYLGKHYRKRDCYVFLVRALEDVGVRYYGSGGIKESLLRKAVDEGRQRYAYTDRRRCDSISLHEPPAKSIYRGPKTAPSKKPGAASKVCCRPGR